jgi:DNA-binding SARP family transcriptional activator
MLNLVGRSQELNHLNQWLCEDRVSLVELLGDPGVGKSALFEHFAGQSIDGALVFHDVCQPVGGVLEPVGLLGRLIDQLAERLEASRLREVFTDRCVRDLATLSPGMVRRATVLADGNFASGVDIPRIQIVEALAELLRRLHKGEHLLWVVDEFQNIDEQSRQILISLLTHPDPAARGFSLAVSYRNSDALSFHEEWSRSAEHHPSRRQFTLKPLTKAGIRELINSELDQSFTKSFPVVVEEFHRLSSGNPFMALMLLRKARRTGRIRASLQGWQLESGKAFEKSDTADLLSDQVESFLKSRPLSRFLLSWFRLVEHPVSIDILMRVAPDMESEWSDLITEMTVGGILKSHDAKSGTRWGFAHPLWYEHTPDWLNLDELRDFVDQVSRVCEVKDSEEFFLRASLMSHPLVISDSISRRAAAQEQLLNVLSRFSNHRPFLAPVLELTSRLAALSLDDAAYSRAVEFLILGNRRLGQVDLFLNWVANSDMSRLDADARYLLIENYQYMLRVRRQVKAFTPWSENLIKSGGLSRREENLLRIERCEIYLNRDETDAALLELDQLEASEMSNNLKLRVKIYQHICNLAKISDLHESLNVQEEFYKKHRSILSTTSHGTLLLRRHLLRMLVLQSYRAGERKRIYPYLEDTMQAATALSDYSSVAQHRSRIARSLLLFERFEVAEEILKENVIHYERCNQISLACEEAYALMNTYRSQRKNAPALQLARKLKPYLLEMPEVDTFNTAFLLTCASVFWRAYCTSEAEACVKHVSDNAGSIENRDFATSMGYCKVQIALQRAETTMSWGDVLEPVERQLDLYKSMGRDDAEPIFFTAIRDRAQASLKRFDSAAACAADLLPLARACSPREFARIPLFIQIGETALLTQEADVYREVDKELEDFAKGPEAYAIAVFRASKAFALGHGAEAVNQLWRALCFAQLVDLPDLVPHLRKRFAWNSLNLKGLDAQSSVLMLIQIRLALVRGNGLEGPMGLMSPQSLSSFACTLIEHVRGIREGFSSAEQKLVAKEMLKLQDHLEVQKPVEKSTLSLRLFAGPSLLRDSVPLKIRKWGSKHGFEILCFLAVNHWRKGAPLSQKEIVEAIWEEGSEPKTPASFRVMITRLRQTLATLASGATILGSKDGYELAPGLIDQLDLHDFEAALKSARAASAAGDEEAASRAYGQMISVYQGALLPELDADWVTPLRAYCENRFLEAARSLLTSLVAKDPKAAVALRWELVERHPGLADELGLSE